MNRGTIFPFGLFTTSLVIVRIWKRFDDGVFVVDKMFTLGPCVCCLLLISRSSVVSVVTSAELDYFSDTSAVLSTG